MAYKHGVYGYPAGTGSYVGAVDGAARQRIDALSKEVEELRKSKAENVHLYCDGSAIYYFDDKTTPLTFDQVKAIIENDVHSVFLSNDYYSFYGKYYFRPEITGQDKEAIGFIGETQIDGEVYSWRVIINEDNEVKEDEIWLAKHDKLSEIEVDITELKQDLSAMPGRNLLPYEYYDSSGVDVSGVTCTVLGDGSIMLNGTTTANSGNFNIIKSDQEVALPAGTYTFSGCDGGSPSTYRLFAAVRYADGSQTSWSCYNEPVTNTARDGGILRLSIAITGAGVVFDHQIFKPMFERGATAHAFEPPANSLRAVEQKVDTLENRTKNVEIVSRFADILSTTAYNVLVLQNDNPGYGDGGPCWFCMRDGEIRGGISRADGSVVFAAAGQGAIVPANADRESLLSVANTYIDNPALVYGSSTSEEGTMFSAHCLPNADGTYNISCSSFVDAVLSKITYNNSRYVLKDSAENIPGQYLGNNYLPTSTAVVGAKPHSANTRELAQYYAQQKRLYILPSDMTKAVDMLEFGDIIFSNADYADDHYYHITHCAIVLGTFRTGTRNRIVVAHSTSSASSTAYHLDFGADGVKVSCIELLQDVDGERNYHLFARPDYGRIPISDVDAAASGVGASVPYRIRVLLLPGLNINNSGNNALGEGAYSASVDLVPVLPETSLTYVGKTVSHDGLGLYVRAYWYDNLGQPLTGSIYSTIYSPSGNYPANVPDGAAYARFRCGVSVSEGKKINWSDCTGCIIEVNAKV